MPDILHTLSIAAPAARVFAIVSTPEGLDAWWTEASAGSPSPGAEYRLRFGPDHDWRARVTACEAPRRFELEFTKADDDWMGTQVRVDLREEGGMTRVEFAHLGWREAAAHFRVSSYCWAMYLRLLRRHVEEGARVPYARRLED